MDIGGAALTRTADLARGASYRQVLGTRRFESEIETHIGVWHETGHAGPWMVAMDCLPTPAAGRDYGLRWGSAPRFSDFKTRGFAWKTPNCAMPIGSIVWCR